MIMKFKAGYNNPGVIALVWLLLGFSSALVAGEYGANSALEKAINGSHRSAEEKARDKYRHPLETLSFFGIKENMHVVEVWPGGGWYTKILATFLKDKGQYTAAGFDLDPQGQWADYLKKSNNKFKENFVDHPDTYGRINVTELAPPKKVEIAPPGSLDMVLTFRNAHNWMSSDNLEPALAAFHKALKSGGILGVTDHRADPKAKIDPKAGNGYVNEADFIKAVEAAGFKLAAKSEINANSKDTKDYEKGVWTLPPTLALKDTDREKYLAIGESDRFTLKFVKK